MKNRRRAGFSTGSQKHSETSEIIYQPLSIDVLPKFSTQPIPQLEAGTTISVTSGEKEPESETTNEFVDAPSPFDFREPEQDAAITFEECRDVTFMIVNIPSMFGMKHLERTEEEITPFAKELQKYCERKGIDPRDYFFDEMGILLTGGALLGGLYRDHRAHKGDKKSAKKQIDTGTGVADSYSRAVPEEKEIPEARPEGATETSTDMMVRR